MPSAAVTVIVGPTGRQPWLTTVRCARSPPSTSPTAPRSCTTPSTSSRVDPGPRRPDALPPLIGSPGRTSCVCSTNASTGNEYGSTSSTAARSSARLVGIPTTAIVSEVRSTSRWNDRRCTPGNRASQTLTDEVSSTPRPPPITPGALQPRTVDAPVSSPARSSAAATSAGSGPQTKTSARSGVTPSRAARASAVASSAARTRSASTAMPSLQRTPVVVCTPPS